MIKYKPSLFLISMVFTRLSLGQTMTGESIKKDQIVEMDKALKNLENDFKGLRTGRAQISILDSIQVKAYGNKMPLNQLGSTSVIEARKLAVQVWDKSVVKDVEKAIIDANLGGTVSSDGQTIRISLPVPSEERRKELVKSAQKCTEQCRVAVRNIRRGSNEDLKKLKKNHDITEDAYHVLVKDVQKLTDQYMDKIESMLQKKEDEILTI